MLKGRYVGLRAIERVDLPKLLEWRNQPELRQYFREYRELSMEHQIIWYENILNDPSNLMFALINLESNDIIGACGLCYIDWKNKNAEVSIYIGQDLLYIDGKYAPDAVGVLVEYAFSELCFHRLWVEVFDFDIKKQNLVIKSGFELEGQQRQKYWAEKQWHDSLFYGLLKED